MSGSSHSLHQLPQSVPVAVPNVTSRRRASLDNQPANRSAAQLERDLLSFRDAGPLRSSLMDIDRLERSHKGTQINAFASGCAIVVGLTSAAPSIASAKQSCIAKANGDDTATCVTNVIASAGGLIGLAGLAGGVYGVVLGAAHFKDHIKDIDLDLYNKYRVIARESQYYDNSDVQQLNTAKNIASRYLSLTKKDRTTLKEALYQVHIRQTTGEEPAAVPAPEA